LQAIYVFAASTGLVTLIALAICLLLRRTLGTLLVELCEGEVRGRFWTLFGQACVVLTTFFTAVVFAPRSAPTTDAPIELFSIFVSALRGGVFGLLFALAILGVVVLFSIAAFNARQRRSARTQPAA
jgi:hypothetical protein